MTILSKNFESDRAVITPKLERFKRGFEIDISNAQRQVEVGVATFVIVDMHVADPSAKG